MCPEAKANAMCKANGHASVLRLHVSVKEPSLKNPALLAAARDLCFINPAALLLDDKSPSLIVSMLRLVIGHFDYRQLCHVLSTIQV